MELLQFGLGIALYASDPAYRIEIERAPDDGSGRPAEAAREIIAEALGNESVYIDLLPADGLRRHYRYRQVREGEAPSDWTCWVSSVPMAMAGTVVRPAPVLPVVRESLTEPGGRRELTLTIDDPQCRTSEVLFDVGAGFIPAAGAGGVYKSPTVGSSSVLRARLMGYDAAGRLGVLFERDFTQGGVDGPPLLGTVVQGTTRWDGDKASPGTILDLVVGSDTQSVRVQYETFGGAKRDYLLSPLEGGSRPSHKLQGIIADPAAVWVTLIPFSGPDGTGTAGPEFVTNGGDYASPGIRIRDPRGTKPIFQADYLDVGEGLTLGIGVDGRPVLLLTGDVLPHRHAWGDLDGIPQAFPPLAHSLDSHTDNLSWSRLSKTGSSLADLATRSAGALNSGTLANARLPQTISISGTLTAASLLDTSGYGLAHWHAAASAPTGQSAPDGTLWAYTGDPGSGGGAGQVQVEAPGVGATGASLLKFLDPVVSVVGGVATIDLDGRYSLATRNIGTGTAATTGLTGGGNLTANRTLSIHRATVDTWYAAKDHGHTATEVGALPIGGGTLLGRLTVNAGGGASFVAFGAGTPGMFIVHNPDHNDGRYYTAITARDNNDLNIERSDKEGGDTTATVFRISNGGQAYVFPNGTAARLWHADNFDPATKSDTGHTHPYLPLAGGTLTGFTEVAAGVAQPLGIKRTNSLQNVSIRFRDQDNGELYVGMQQVGTFAVAATANLSASPYLRATASGLDIPGGTITAGGSITGQTIHDRTGYGLAHWHASTNAPTGQTAPDGTMWAYTGEPGSGGVGSLQIEGESSQPVTASLLRFRHLGISLDGSGRVEINYDGRYSQLGHTHAAGDVTSGTFAAARIPSLDASKINAGTFDAARIPSLDASKITAGTFAAARIPNLDASKINAGTLALARLPVATSGTVSSTQVVRADDSRLSDARAPTAHSLDSHTGTLSWSNLSKAGSSLADLATRSAGALNSGTLANARLPQTISVSGTITAASLLDTSGYGLAHWHAAASAPSGQTAPDGTIWAYTGEPQGGGGLSNWEDGYTTYDARYSQLGHGHTIGQLPVAASGVSSSTQVVRADDSRLSNSRTPTSHSLDSHSGTLSISKGGTGVTTGPAAAGMYLRSTPTLAAAWSTLSASDLFGVIAEANLPKADGVNYGVVQLGSASNQAAIGTHSHQLSSLGGQLPWDLISNRPINVGSDGSVSVPADFSVHRTITVGHTLVGFYNNARPNGLSNRVFVEIGRAGSSSNAGILAFPEDWTGDTWGLQFQTNGAASLTIYRNGDMYNRDGHRVTATLYDTGTPSGSAAEGSVWLQYA